MRWPPPRAQTAQPERWRMRRWSKEPRRMSVVEGDRKSTRLNSSHDQISYAVFCLKKKKNSKELAVDVRGAGVERSGHVIVTRRGAAVSVLTTRRVRNGWRARPTRRTRQLPGGGV